MLSNYPLQFLLKWKVNIVINNSAALPIQGWLGVMDFTFKNAGTMSVLLSTKNPKQNIVPSA